MHPLGEVDSVAESDLEAENVPRTDVLPNTDKVAPTAVGVEHSLTAPDVLADTVAWDDALGAIAVREASIDARELTVPLVVKVNVRGAVAVPPLPDAALALRADEDEGVLDVLELSPPLILPRQVIEAAEDADA